MPINTNQNPLIGQLVNHALADKLWKNLESMYCTNEANFVNSNEDQWKLPIMHLQRDNVEVVEKWLNLLPNQIIIPEGLLNVPGVFYPALCVNCIKECIDADSTTGYGMNQGTAFKQPIKPNSALAKYRNGCNLLNQNMLKLMQNKVSQSNKASHQSHKFINLMHHPWADFKYQMAKGLSLAYREDWEIFDTKVSNHIADLPRRTKYDIETMTYQTRQLKGGPYVLVMVTPWYSWIYEQFNHDYETDCYAIIHDFKQALKSGKLKANTPYLAKLKYKKNK